MPNILTHLCPIWWHIKRYARERVEGVGTGTEQISVGWARYSSCSTAESCIESSTSLVAALPVCCTNERHLSVTWFLRMDDLWDCRNSVPLSAFQLAT